MTRDGRLGVSVPDMRRVAKAVGWGATDGRNYVKKAVSWALRQVGKRNATLRRAGLNPRAEAADPIPPHLQAGEEENITLSF